MSIEHKSVAATATNSEIHVLSFGNENDRRLQLTHKHPKVMDDDVTAPYSEEIHFIDVTKEQAQELGEKLLAFANDKLEYDEKNETSFSIFVTMRTRWVPTFLGLIKTMQQLGDLGSSRRLSFYSDGDGDYRPKFSWNIKSDYSKAMWEYRDGSEEGKFDAG